LTIRDLTIRREKTVARVALVQEAERPELAGLIATIRAERGGRLPNLYRALLNSPPVAEGWLKLFTAIRQKTKLSGKLRELAILRVGLLNGATYEVRAHVPFGLAEGMSQAQIDAIENWRESKLFSKEERAVLGYADAMTRDIRVPDALFAELKGFLDEREIVELTTTIAGYNLVSRFLEAIHVDQERPAAP
jgi:alkylhydroperoxidase family enzyme